MGDPVTVPYRVTLGSTIQDGWPSPFSLISLSVDNDAISLETRNGPPRTWKREDTEAVVYGRLRGKYRPFSTGVWWTVGRWFGIQLVSGEIPPVAVTTVFGQSQLIRALEYRGWPVIRKSWSPS